MLLCLAAALLSPVALRAQGLVAIQNYSADFKTEQPLTFSFTGQGGFDSLQYKATSPLVQGFESWYAQGGFGAYYTDVDRTTPWAFSLDTSVIHYIDGGPASDDTFYNARGTFNFEHRFSERLKMSNNFYLTYGVEPNNAFGYGGSTTLWNGQYLYGFNNFNVSYAWTPRFSTTTSYTVDGITYDDKTVSTSEDRFSHLFAQQFSYSLSKRTSLALEYRYRMTNYQNTAGKNYHSHYGLVGVDHAWSERTSGSVRVGAEMYESDRVSKTSPYAEGAINYAVDRHTMVRWFAALGFNGAELAAFNSRYGLNTGIQVSHQVTKRVNVNGSATYSYSQFQGGAGTDVEEHAGILSAGIGYQLLENLNLNANYSFSLLQSTDALREFDRHRVSLGATATF